MGRSEGCTGQSAANEHQEIKTLNFMAFSYLKTKYLKYLILLLMIWLF